MGGMTRRVGDLERALEQALPAAQDTEVRLGDGNHLPPQAVHVLAVEPPALVISRSGSIRCATPRSWT